MSEAAKEEIRRVDREWKNTVRRVYFSCRFCRWKHTVLCPPNVHDKYTAPKTSCAGCISVGTELERSTILKSFWDKKRQEFLAKQREEMPERKLAGGGLRVFVEIEPVHDAYGFKLIVEDYDDDYDAMATLVTQDPKAGNATVDVMSAKALIAGLQVFIEEAEAGWLMRPAESSFTAKTTDFRNALRTIKDLIDSMRRAAPESKWEFYEEIDRIFSGLVLN